MNDQSPQRVHPFDTQGAEDAARQLLASFGEDITRERLHQTPRRVAKAWREMLVGYDQDPAEVLCTSGGAKGFRERAVAQNAFSSNSNTCQSGRGGLTLSAA